MICGSFKLFSKQCADNLIIRCKQSCSVQSVDKKKTSQVDVVFQLERSETGQVMSNINSIMILDTFPTEQQEATRGIKALQSVNCDEPKEKKIKIIDVSNTEHQNENMAIEEENKSDSSAERETTNSLYSGDKESMESTGEDTCHKTSANGDENAENETSCDTENALQEQNESSCSEINYTTAELLKSTLKIIDNKSTSNNELAHRSLVCDDLHLNMRSLVMPDTLPEETEDNSTPNKTKSPTRVRVKSPYENKSRIIEEKKRKKLLEIKERRERKRNALNENNRITKHKFTNRSPIMPQASGSVTKLSISNKSFYNDIYGKNVELENKINKARYRKREPVSNVSLDENDNNDYIRDIIQLPTKSNKKYLSKDFSSDDSVTDTEVTGSVSKSSLAVPMECKTNLSILKQHVQPSMIDIKDRHTKQLQKTLDILDTVNSETSSDISSSVNKKSNYKEKVTDSSRPTTTDDCRESIDKVYDLMNKLENSVSTKSDYSTSDAKTKKTIDIEMTDIRNLTIQDSESDSVKHQSVSSYPSNISIEKPVPKPRARNIEPKVIINNKYQQNTKENIKVNRKMFNHGSIATPVDENPLKAISQLLHDIEHVQKKRKKTTFDPKAIKKSEETQKENRLRLRFNIDSKRQPDDRPTADKYHHFNTSAPKAIPRTNLTIQSPRHMLKPTPEERHTNFTKKKLSDILDEVKEARGEAVRGPTKLNSRLNTLAQPKKSYVQAHNQEYQSRYGRTIASDRLLRLAAAERSSNIRNKQRRGGQDTSSVRPPPASSIPPLETLQRKRPRSRSPTHRAHGNAKSSQKQHTGRISSIPKPTAALESSIKSNYVHETSAKTMLQHAKLRDFNATNRFQPPSLNLEYFEIKSNLTDSINTMISTIPMDYKKSEPDMKNNKTLSLTKFVKRDSLIAEDGSFDEEEEYTYYDQSTNKSKTSKDTELTKLETKLNNRGVFQKRLRMKKLTLTPKPSSQHMLIVHTGDGNSAVVLKSNTSKSDVNYPIQSFSRYITNIPLQMFSVGYAFQQYRSFNAKFQGDDNVKRNSSIISVTNSVKSNPIQKQISDSNTNAKERSLTEINRTAKSKKHVETELKYSTSASNVLSKTRSITKTSGSDLICIAEGNISTIPKCTVPNNEDVNLSTSLDILVELLGEIKNITCQSQLSSQEYDNKEIKNIFNNISFENKNLTDKGATIDVSTSIQNDLNIFSQLNNDTQEIYLRSYSSKPNRSQATISRGNNVMVLDKEISVKLKEKEYVNRVTEIPSQILQLNFSRSTSITNSLMHVCNKPSTYTMYSLAEDCSVCSSTSLVPERKSTIMELNKSDNQETMLVKFEEAPKIRKPTVIFKKNNYALLKSKSTVNRNVKRFKPQRHITINSSGIDSIMKLKRDVLVTVYSILVVTIFAALSLPQVV